MNSRQFWLEPSAVAGEKGTRTRFGQTALRLKRG